MIIALRKTEWIKFPVYNFSPYELQCFDLLNKLKMEMCVYVPFYK